MATERYVCTKENPWTKDKGMACHPDAVDVGTCSEGCCDDYLCPWCKLKFRVENAQ